MDTPYGERINTTPVIYMTFKDCKGKTAEDMTYLLRKELLREYLRYKPWTEANLSDSYEKERYHEILQTLKEQNTPYLYLTDCLVDLTRIVNSCFQKKPILLIDEYDQPVTSSYEHNYHDAVSTFFSNFYGMALKGNSNLHQALLTGVQRVAKESIFSQLNNPQIYTVMDTEYAPYFGLNVEETEKLLTDYGLELTDNVRKMYDGYLIGGQSMYNPWSILNYAKKRRLENFWVRTSSNYLVREALSHADRTFWDSFDELATGNETTVWLTLDTAFMERASTYSLWGLLANAGYITITKWIDSNSAVIRIPNGEVMAEFQMLITEIAGIDGQTLSRMFSCLISKDMDTFFRLYQDIVISCTSFMDAKENAYHMLFLGMCITLRGAYKVTSNLESGYGRSDITLESLTPGQISVIVEFKQGEDIDKLKELALEQILNQKYYTGLKGEVICVGLAHNKKRCSMSYQSLTL